MTAPGDHPPADNPPADHPGDVHAEAGAEARDDGQRALEGLRELLLGEERTRIRELHDLLAAHEVTPEDVARVLPDAVRRREREDRALDEALAPTIEKAITVSVQKNPEAIAEGLFPIFAPAIRKAIADALMRLVQTLNQTLEHSLSPRSWRWRVEAWRTGRSFAEVVLTHTLLYRVEQVFLIYRESGILLEHVHADTVEARDGDLVSGMLTAIQDFVSDSFAVDAGDSLDALRVGELTVWVERGPQAALAAVIRGTPPLSLRAHLQTGIEDIHRLHAEALTSFDGDTRPFASTQPDLEACLVSAARGAEKRAKRGVLGWVAVASILLAVGIGLFLLFRGDPRWPAYLDRLRAEPGLLVVETARRGGRYELTGLKDPLAADPASLLADAGLAADEVRARWDPYYSLELPMVVARAVRALGPPTSVKLTLEGDVLTAAGRAPHAWIGEARTRAPTIPGVGRYHDEDLVDLDRERLDRSRRSLAARVVNFRNWADDPTPGADLELRAAARDVSDVLDAANTLALAVEIIVTGHLDEAERSQSHLELRHRRAAAVVCWLGQHGIPAGRLRVDRESDDTKAAALVTFRVVEPRRIR